MSDAAWEPLPSPDASRLVTEDDAPVDNFPSEKNQRLLVSALYSSWRGPPPQEADEPDPRPFLAAANVGLFATPKTPPLVPDVLLSTDVSIEQMTWADDEPRAYLMWEMGKPPELAIELVSNREGDELGKKSRGYARMHVSYYLVYDPAQRLGDEVLHAFESRGDILQPVATPDGHVWLESLRLGLILWEGTFEGTRARWLRFVNADGELLLTGDERAEQERERAEQERERAEQERERAERERERAKEADERAEQADERAEQADERAERAEQRANTEGERAERERERAERFEALLRQKGLEPE